MELTTPESLGYHRADKETLRKDYLNQARTALADTPTVGPWLFFSVEEVNDMLDLVNEKYNQAVSEDELERKLSWMHTETLRGVHDDLTALYDSIAQTNWGNSDSKAGILQGLKLAMGMVHI